MNCADAAYGLWLGVLAKSGIGYPGNRVEVCSDSHSHKANAGLARL